MPTGTVPGDIQEYLGRRTEKKWAPIARVVDALQFVWISNLNTYKRLLTG